MKTTAKRAKKAKSTNPLQGQSVLPAIFGILVGLGAATIIFISTHNEQKAIQSLKPVALRYLAVTLPQTQEIGHLGSTDDFTKLTTTIAQFQGIYGLYIKNLTTGQAYTYNDEKNFYAASLYKVPIAIATYKEIEAGELTENQKVTYLDVHYADGAGIIKNELPGTDFTIEQLVSYLLKDSDNVAQLMLTQYVNDQHEAAAFSAYTNKGFASNFYTQTVTSPNEMASVFTGLYFDSDYNATLNTGFLGDYGGFITGVYAQKIIDNMKQTAFDDRINSGLDQNLQFAHKIGNWEETGSWHDCGLVFGKNVYSVCLMSLDTNYEDFLTVAKLVGEFISGLEQIKF